MSSKRPIWLQLENETPKAYDAFVVYRDLSPEVRSYGKVAEIKQKGNRWIQYWGSQHNWVERAKAYDVSKDEKSIETTQALRDNLKAKEIEVYEEALRVAQDGLKNFRIRQQHTVAYVDDPERTDSNGRPLRMKVIEIKTDAHAYRAMISSIQDIFKGMRLALGMPTNLNAQAIDISSHGEKITGVQFIWADFDDNSGFDEDDIIYDSID